WRCRLAAANGVFCWRRSAAAHETRRGAAMKAREASEQRVGAAPRPAPWRLHLIRIRGRYVFWTLLIILLGVYFSSGFYVVAADERAVVRRFGVVAGPIGPGMHFRLPWPV